PPGPHRDYDQVDAHLKARIPVEAGQHSVGVTFLKNPTSLLETKRQPHAARFNFHRHPRLGPAVYQVTITGPHGSSSPGSSASRQRILTGQPETPAKEENCAREILSGLMRRAYRRPLTDAELEGPMAF